MRRANRGWKGSSREAKEALEHYTQATCQNDHVVMPLIIIKPKRGCEARRMSI